MGICWLFRDPFPEHQAEFLELVADLGPRFDARLEAAAEDLGEGPGWRVRADFDEEESGREFWLELHSRCLDLNLALELAETPPASPWGSLEEARAAVRSLPAPRTAGAGPERGLSPLRPPLPSEPIYDLLRADDPDLDRNLDETIDWIESAGLPVINLLSYLELPLFLAYAAEHPEERDQNLFLHMLHTWTCYRRFGAVHAAIPEDLAAAFTAPRYLRINTTQFRSPAPALCIQLPPWTYQVRPFWVKEIYLTHIEPPTPADDRELTLLFVTHDERGEFAFVPLEVPLSLPAVGESIDAFFAPGMNPDDADEVNRELGANATDLHRLTAIAATWCLYATARDPARYLG